MKGWNRKEFNGSDWTDSSLLTTQHIAICLHTKAFPTTVCAGSTAPHSWDNPRKLTASTCPCLLHCTELSSSATARNMDCLVQEPNQMILWLCLKLPQTVIKTLQGISIMILLVISLSFHVNAFSLESFRIFVYQKNTQWAILQWTNNCKSWIRILTSNGLQRK